MSGNLEQRLWEAIEDKDYRRARSFLRSGAQTDKLSEDGIAVIHFLSGIDGAEANQLLIDCLENDADPNIPSCDGITPVHVAAIWGITDNLSTLIEYGGIVDVQDADGMSPLDYAKQSVEYQAKDCVKLLTDLTYDNKGYTYTKIKTRSDSAVVNRKQYLGESSSVNKYVNGSKASLATKDIEPPSYFSNQSGLYYRDVRDLLSEDEASLVSLDQTKVQNDSSVIRNFIPNNPRQTTRGSKNHHAPRNPDRRCFINGRSFMTEDEASSISLDQTEENDDSLFIDDYSPRKQTMSSSKYQPAQTNPDRKCFIDGRSFMTEDEASSISLDQTEENDDSLFIDDYTPRKQTTSSSKYQPAQTNPDRRCFIDGRSFMTEDEASSISLDQIEENDDSLFIDDYTPRKQTMSSSKYQPAQTNPDRRCFIDGRSFMTEDEASSISLDQIEENDDSLFIDDYTPRKQTMSSSKYQPALTNPDRRCFIDGRDFMTEDESNSKSLLSTSSSSSFHTANEGEISMAFASALDDTVITFPKLHPWTVTQNEIDLDDTIIDGINDLDIRSTSENLERISNTIIINSSINDTLSDGTVLYDWKEYSILEAPQSSNDSDHVSLVIPQSMLTMGCKQLREELLKLGDDPGPITADTRMLYVRRLARIQSGLTDGKHSDRLKEYLPEVRGIIEGRLPSPEMDTVEDSMCVEFTKTHLRSKWREGTEKSSFNYLLLDPRVTQNLPVRSKKMAYEDIFHTFVAAIFYVGKGKRSRPYAHLHEAANLSKVNSKLQQIRDIWSAGLGVVSIHCFQGVIPVEAYTREACLVEALGLARLTNQKRCDYYGRAKTWSLKKKRQMGVYLLKRALQIFLNEGERQMRPEDLRRS